MLQLDENNVHSYHNRGISYDKKEEYDKAIADFTKVLQLEPMNANAYFNRGSAYDAKGEFDAAIRDYTTALELDLVSSQQLGGDTLLQSMGPG